MEWAYGAYNLYKFLSGLITREKIVYQDGCVQYKLKIRFKLGEIFGGIFDFIDEATGIAKAGIDWLRSSVSKAKEFLDSFLCNDVLETLQSNGGIKGVFASAAQRVKGIIMDGLDQFDGGLKFGQDVLDKVNGGINVLKESCVEIYASVTMRHPSGRCLNHPTCVGVGCTCYLHET